MAMVYNITEVVKDWLLDRNVPKQVVGVVFVVSCNYWQEGSMYDEMMKRMQKEQEAVDAAAAAVGMVGVCE